MSGVRWFLDQCNVNTGFLDSSRSIRTTKAGMEIIYRQQITEKDTKTLPLTAGMISFIVNNLYNGNSIKSLAIRSACQVGYSCLMRIGEYVKVSNKVHHHLLSNDVQFIFDSSVLGESPVYIDSHLIFISNCKREDCTGIIFTIRHRKNDKGGSGQSIPFEKQQNSEDLAFDLIGNMFDWANVAKPLKNAPFFSDNSGWNLTQDLINKACKEVALHFGFNSDLFSTHSLRIGGASALAAANCTDYLIQILGGWKSLCFLRYLRLSIQAYSLALKALTSKKIFSVEALRQLNPSGFLSFSSSSLGI